MILFEEKDNKEFLKELIENMYEELYVCSQEKYMIIVKKKTKSVL